MPQGTATLVITNLILQESVIQVSLHCGWELLSSFYLEAEKYDISADLLFTSSFESCLKIFLTQKRKKAACRKDNKNTCHSKYFLY